MASPPKVTNDARILIIDDDARCAVGLARMLGKKGYTGCTTITCPTIAAKRFTELRPDLVLLDLHMEPLSGIDVLKTIHETTKPIDRPPVVMLTADTTVEAKHEALAAGAAAFLAKPLDMIEVMLRIENLLTTRDLNRRCQHYSHGLERLLDKRTAELRTSDLEKAILESRDKQQQVVQEERMRSLTTMAAGIAHDLNNGLFLILTYGNILLRDSTMFPPESDARSALEKILLAGQDNAELVKRLGAFHRPFDTLDREVIDLNQLIEEALALTASRWQPQRNGDAPILIKKDFGKISRITGVPAELREVLTNLIFNAVDAMPHGGSLSFRTRAKGENVELQISDTGQGMTEETLRKCFEPFFTTKGEAGSGLGLAMSYGIIRRHGGTITLHSHLNEGATFTIFLPASKKTPSSNGQRSVNGARTRSKKRSNGLLR